MKKLKLKKPNPLQQVPSFSIEGTSGDAFWRTTPLADMTPSQWESLCDGCGRCCLEKLQDFDTDEISYTDVGCTLLDPDTCRCAHYDERHRYMPDCVPLNPNNIAELRWMPSTCAYRLLAQGQDLPAWHPLISGSFRSVEDAGMSIKGRFVRAHDAGDLEDHIVTWAK